MGREIKFRAWVKHTTDNRWNWAYKKTEEKIDESPDIFEACAHEQVWRSEFLEQWDKDNPNTDPLTIKHLMVYGEEVGTYLSGKKIISHGYELLELMQFTGLHDKNGKPIYEGDILKVSKEYGVETEVKNGPPYDTRITHSELGVMKWIDKEAKFSIELKDSYFEEEYGHSIEVIGDIYSNPELLQMPKEDTRPKAPNKRSEK